MPLKSYQLKIYQALPHSTEALKFNNLFTLKIQLIILPPIDRFLHFPRTIISNSYFLPMLLLSIIDLQNRKYYFSNQDTRCSCYLIDLYKSQPICRHQCHNQPSEVYLGQYQQLKFFEFTLHLFCLFSLNRNAILICINFSICRQLRRSSRVKYYGCCISESKFCSMMYYFLLLHIKFRFFVHLISSILSEGHEWDNEVLKEQKESHLIFFQQLNIYQE